MSADMFGYFGGPETPSKPIPLPTESEIKRQKVCDDIRNSTYEKCERLPDTYSYIAICKDMAKKQCIKCMIKYPSDTQYQSVDSHK